MVVELVRYHRIGEARYERFSRLTSGNRGTMSWFSVLKLGLDLRSFLVSDRVHAVKALAQSDDPRALSLLTRALRDPHARVRQEAALGLGQAGLNALVNPLVAALADADMVVRKHALASLRQLVGADATVMLMPALADADPEVRTLVIETVGEVGDARDVDTLLAALDDPAEDVRESAARALGKLGDPRAIDPLLSLLRYDEGGEVRAVAAEALGKIGDPRVINPLLAAIADTEEWVQFRAIGALIGFGEMAVEPLIFLLTHGKPQLRIRAAAALGKVGHARAVDPLRAALKDRSPDLRKAAAEALGAIGDDAAVNPLLLLLNDEAPGVRWKAAEALGMMRSPHAIRPLIEFAASDDTAADAFRVLREILAGDPSQISASDLHALTRMDLVISRLTGGAAVQPSLRNDNSLIKQYARQELQRREQARAASGTPAA